MEEEEEVKEERHEKYVIENGKYRSTVLSPKVSKWMLFNVDATGVIVKSIGVMPQRGTYHCSTSTCRYKVFKTACLYTWQVTDKYYEAIHHIK